MEDTIIFGSFSEFSIQGITNAEVLAKTEDSAEVSPPAIKSRSKGIKSK